jgi:hypothetical protein
MKLIAEHRGRLRDQPFGFRLRSAIRFHRTASTSLFAATKHQESDTIVSAAMVTRTPSSSGITKISRISPMSAPFPNASSRPHWAPTRVSTWLECGNGTANSGDGSVPAITTPSEGFRCLLRQPITAQARSRGYESDARGGRRASTCDPR